MIQVQLNKLLLTAIKATLKAGTAILEVYKSSDFEITTKSDNSPLTLADRNAHTEIDKILELTKYPILSEEGKDIPYEERKNWEYFWLVDPVDGTKEFIKKNGEFTVNIALIHKNKPVLGVIFIPVEKKLYFAAEGLGSYRLDNFDTIGLENIDELINSATKLKGKALNNSLTIIASRSHLNIKTFMFIEKMKKKYKDISIISKGSSIKLCLIAEGSADVYPRHSPTMEWDTAAGHAIVNCSGGRILIKDGEHTLDYNKENLLNPPFTVYCSGFSDSL